MRVRVQEADAAGDADARLLVDQLRAARLQRGQVAVDVIDLEADVVQALALALEIARDAGVRHDGLQQLDLAVAERQERRLHALLLDRLQLVHVQAERVAVEAHRLVHVAHDDADVVDFLDHAASVSKRCDEGGAYIARSRRMRSSTGGWVSKRPLSADLWSCRGFAK